MNTTINFEIAKLIKQKGFNVPTLYFYLDGKLKYNHSIQPRNNNRDTGTCEVSAPTIADVIMWLYEKHGVWIEVSCHTVLDEKDDDVDVDVFYFIVRGLKPVNILYSGDFVNLPTEAYEAAIEYTLKNLI